MRFLVIAALVATACAMDYSGPSWPRLPLDLILHGDKPVYYSDDKIVGGAEVVPNSIPSQISLQRGAGASFSQSCGGSILAESTILNAAHCVDGVSNLAIFRVVAGEHSLSQTSGKEQIRSVTKYTKHENYVSSTFLNDIALIFLDRPLTLNADVEPIVLPTENSETPEGANLYVTGWGTTSSGGSISDVLRGVEVPFVNDTQCNVYYPDSIAPSMICAGVEGVDSCQGDSGGPLFAAKGNNTQIGIVSWGRGCAARLSPGVYTEVSKFIKWIADNNVVPPPPTTAEPIISTLTP